MIEIIKYTGDDKYAETARYITDSLLEEAEKTDDGHIISGESGILADGGNILYLIYASKHFENQDYLDLAVSLADHITAHAEVVAEQTIKFHPLNQDYIVDYLDLDPSEKYEWPNFEYGTAGVGFVLAKLYQATGEAKYLTAAEKAANYIDSIASKMGPAGGTAYVTSKHAVLGLTKNVAAFYAKDGIYSARVELKVI